MTDEEETWLELRMAARRVGAHLDSVVDLLDLPSVRKRIQIDGSEGARFLDEHGDPMLGVTPEDFFAALAESKRPYFERR